MTEQTVVPFRAQQEEIDPLTKILRSGARKLLAEAIEPWTSFGHPFSGFRMAWRRQLGVTCISWSTRASQLGVPFVFGLTLAILVRVSRVTEVTPTRLERASRMGRVGRSRQVRLGGVARGRRLGLGRPGRARGVSRTRVVALVGRWQRASSCRVRPIG